MIENPAYKGKWSKPMIDNPNYSGVWAPKEIENPFYFEADNYSDLGPIGAVAIEILANEAGIAFDNFFGPFLLKISKLEVGNRESKYPGIKKL